MTRLRIGTIGKIPLSDASKRIENLGIQATNALQSATLGRMTEDRVKRDRSMRGDKRNEDNFTLDRTYHANQRASYSRPSSAFGLE